MAAVFRFASKRVHLTYAGHLSLDDEPGSLFSFLGGLGEVECFSVVHEAGHAQGEEGEAYDHTHAFFQWKKRLNTRNARYFDFVGVHPHIQTVRDDHHATTIYESYHHKAPLLLKQSPTGPQGAKDVIQRIRDAQSLWEAVHVAGVEIKSVGDVKLLRDDVARPDDFQHGFPDANWSLELDNTSRVIYIYGPTNTGKTQWAVHCFENPLIVSHMDDLGRFNSSKHDGIVFDDMSFAHIPREAAIHLLDWDFERSLHIRYKCALIPKHTRKIFTSNKPFHESFPHDDTGAIKRRVSKTIHIHGPTFHPEPNGQGENALELHALGPGQNINDDELIAFIDDALAEI